MSKRAFSTLRILPFSGRIAGFYGYALLRRAARGVPFHGTVRTAPGRVPDSPPVCPADRLNRARLYDGSFHGRDAPLHARAASIILPTTIFASDGFSSRYSLSSSFICCSTADFTSEETSLSLVCEENFGSGTLRKPPQSDLHGHRRRWR